MELILNLVWLFIALALVCFWRTHWVHQRLGRSRGRMQEWSAVSLALVLLFFAVSMSDDLHSEIVALEELSANKRDHVHSEAAHPSADLSFDVHPVFAVASTGWPSLGDSYAISVAPSATPAFEFPPSLKLKPGRAPPAIPL
jgi:hypothetical protein